MPTEDKEGLLSSESDHDLREGTVIENQLAGQVTDMVTGDNHKQINHKQTYYCLLA